MSKSMTRRELLKVAGAFGGAALLSTIPFGRMAFAQPSKMTFLGHKVHELIVTGKRGGAAIDLLTPFLKKNGIDRAEWITFGLDNIHDRLFREASLPSTAVDVGYLLNSFAYPRIANLFEPLDDWQEKMPIEDFGDFFPGMMANNTFNGKLYGIPMRHATSILHYNREYVEEGGLNGPPKTIEEFFEYAKKLTFTNKNGEKVYGLVIQGSQRTAFYALIRNAMAWDGAFITPDYEVVVNEEPVVNALTMLRDLFKYGAIPPNFTSSANKEKNLMIKEGRAAMCGTGSNYHSTFNDPETSKVAGKVDFAPYPIASGLKDKFEVAPAPTEFWSYVIPKNAQNKEYSWRYVREMSSKKSVVNLALNGNSPVRESSYSDPQFMKQTPYAEVEQKVLKVARVPWPAFPEVSKAIDILGQAVQMGMLGVKSPKQALDDAARQMEPLMPKVKA